MGAATQRAIVSPLNVCGLFAEKNKNGPTNVRCILDTHYRAGQKILDKARSIAKL